jgi:hypothetical protein
MTNYSVFELEIKHLSYVTEIVKFKKIIHSPRKEFTTKMGRETVAWSS